MLKWQKNLLGVVLLINQILLKGSKTHVLSPSFKAICKRTKLLFELQSCCSCGYPLNLTSSNRITSNIGSGYKKSIKKGYISFLSVDLSRFTQVDEVNCLPVSWGRYRSKSKLLCRKCGVHVGYGYGDSPVLCGFDSPNSSSSAYKKFTIKIRALQPPEDSDRGSFGLALLSLHLQCLSILQSHALKLLSHNLDCCFGITGNGLSLVAASCSSLEYLIAGVNGSGLGGFSPPSIHMNAGGQAQCSNRCTVGDEVHCSDSLKNEIWLSWGRRYTGISCDKLEKSFVSIVVEIFVILGCKHGQTWFCRLDAHGSYLYLNRVV
ncbi:hypothetical protein OIU77_011146 [Salix suchowensis]|uniref:Yippee domain-containing protein n=1 Tax=Salix suchowensis TaxID=1278906 RepID=A0ABQ9AB95_9ROSI|nr:hypothetical protein OIU77_011146 [Salix suchowensis]